MNGILRPNVYRGAFPGKGTRDMLWIAALLVAWVVIDAVVVAVVAHLAAGRRELTAGALPSLPAPASPADNTAGPY